jgi:hypothetical protein
VKTISAHFSKSTVSNFRTLKKYSSRDTIRLNRHKLFVCYDNFVCTIIICCCNQLHTVFLKGEGGYTQPNTTTAKAKFINVHFVEVSGLYVQSSQTLGFSSDFLYHRERGMVYYQVFVLSPLQRTVTEL